MCRKRLQKKITAEAARQGQGVPDVAQNLVEKRVTPRPYDPAAKVALLCSFEEGDPEEQRTTLEYLKVATDRDRPGQRSIFGDGVNPAVLRDEIHCLI